MARSSAEFRDDVRSQLGLDLGALALDEDIDLWINRGKSRLGARLPKSQALTWLALDASVALPSDFGLLSMIHPTGNTTYVPAHRIWADTMVFYEPECVDGGTATLYYFAEYPDITGEADSVMSAREDDACVSFALYRFFTRLASSRSDYRRYVTLTGANGVQPRDLLEIAAEHLVAFNESAGSIDLEAPVTYYGD